MAIWTEHDIPDQSGRTVLVTGANSGLGLRTSLVLANKGARVLMACRSPERGQAALHAVTEGGGTAELVQVDLADLASIREAAPRIRELCADRLDVLINNAGVMMTPKRQTKDGFELQFGTNHLGHAALTWLLMPALRGGTGARVVTVSSLTSLVGRINFADPNFRHRYYLSVTGYAQSKLANLLFTLELARRARAIDLDLCSVAAHPGYTSTELSTNMARSRGKGFQAKILEFIGGLGDLLLAQSVAQGALPSLYAATAPNVSSGEYYGPSGLTGTHGYPKRFAIPRAARNTETARKLWNLTAEMTNVQPDPR